MQTDKKHIWILEDDADAEFVFKDALLAHYELTFFRDRRSFLIRLGEARNPDLILLDLRLEDGFSLDMSQDISFAEKKPLLDDIPIIAVSGIDDVDVLRDCYKFGVEDFISKPFTRSEILVKVERLLSNGPVGNQAFHLNFELQTLTYNGEETDELTTKEFRILAALVNESSLKIPRNLLETKVWKNTYVNAKTLEVHVSNLRKKLKPIGLNIVYSDNYYELNKQA